MNMNKSHESHESHESHDSYLQRMCIWNNTDYSLYKSILTILHKEYYLQNDDIESNINIFGNGMNNKDIINEFIYYLIEKCDSFIKNNVYINNMTDISDTSIDNMTDLMTDTSDTSTINMTNNIMDITKLCAKIIKFPMANNLICKYISNLLKINILIFDQNDNIESFIYNDKHIYVTIERIESDMNVIYYPLTFKNIKMEYFNSKYFIEIYKNLIKHLN